MKSDTFNAFLSVNLILFMGFNLLLQNPQKPKIAQNEQISQITTPPTQTPMPTPTPTPLPTEHYLTGGTHAFQTFNNCGPASLSMALSHYGINVSQKTLGDELRPWQNAAGNNDDKSVTLPELAEKSKDFGLTPFHRPAGNEELVKEFINLDIPVITRTLLETNSDIGHYRVIIGYNDQTQSFLQDDSLQGNDLFFTYPDYNELWKAFNYEFLVLVPENKIKIAQEILGRLENKQTAWQTAARMSQEQLQKSPNDTNARFNLSVAYYNLGDYQRSVEEFEKVQSQLPFRTLWYQIEPILAYYELENYEKVFELTDQIINNHNRAFSELYALRAEVYLKQGNPQKALEEYQNAVFYKSTDETYQQKLNSIQSLI